VNGEYAEWWKKQLQLKQKRRENVGETVGETVGEILRILQANPKITRKGLSERLQLSIRGVEWNLAKMKREGLIRRIGPNKGGDWEVPGERPKKAPRC
jgi:ATP-dependent DNA helicase RecG